jgi:hypothetical protein
MLIIVAMPKFFVVWWPALLTHSPAIANSGDGLEPFHHVAEGDARHIAGLGLDKDDPMEVIRHDDGGIERDSRELVRYGVPDFVDHVPDSVRDHDALTHIAEAADVVFRARDDVIEPWSSIVIPREAWVLATTLGICIQGIYLTSALSYG